MGSEIFSQKIKKIRIVGYEDQQQHEGAPRSSKDLSPCHRASKQTHRASGKAKKRGEATQQKAHEAPHLHDSYHAGNFSRFSPSFKKRYYGELARNTQSHPVWKRTPRIPVAVPMDRNSTDDATSSELKNAISSIKKNNDMVSNDCANFWTNECSLVGRSRIIKSTKGVEYQTFLKTKGTGDTETFQNQQPLQRTGMGQIMDRGQTSKVGHETLMEVREGNKPVGLLKGEHMISEFISSDDMLVLNVLQSLVSAANKMSKVNINFSSGTLTSETTLSDTDRKGEGVSPVDRCKQGKPVNECSAYSTNKQKHTKTDLLDAEVPAEELNVAHSINITKDSLNSDSVRGIGGLLESTANISSQIYSNVPREINPEISMPRRRKMKHKIHRQKYHASCNEISDNLQARKLLHCLSSESLRRWCTYEWFYSAVDFLWFMDNEFAKYLNHPYLRHISRMARSEWSIVRSYFGKPRRFSDNFLVVERKKLEDYREKARKYYAQLSDGSLDYLPVDLARPFSIGQQVIVRHPSSRELCDGKVVMVETDCYKVQFDNPELGVDIVKDTDCMPLDWLDNLSDDNRSTSVLHDVHSVLEMEHIPNYRPGGNRDHTINGLSLLTEQPDGLDTTQDEQLEAEYSVDSEETHNDNTSNSIVQTIDFRSNNEDYYDQLKSDCCAFVQSMQSQARDMVDEVLQAIPRGSDSEDEEAGAGKRNGATKCVCSDSGAATRHIQLPSNLIMNCTATVLAIKHLADSRHPSANIAGVLELLSRMLWSSCSENLAISRDIEQHISIITSQIVALLPTTLGNAYFSSNKRPFLICWVQQ